MNTQDYVINVYSICNDRSNVYLDVRGRDALYTYVNVCCCSDGQRAPLQQREAKRARTPTGFARTRIFVLRSQRWSARCADLGIGCCLLRARPRGPGDDEDEPVSVAAVVCPARPPAPARGMIDAYSRTSIECCQGRRVKRRAPILRFGSLISLVNNFVAVLSRGCQRVLFQTFDVTSFVLRVQSDLHSTKVTSVLSPIRTINLHSCMLCLCQVNVNCPFPMACQ